jgi:3-phenylpropionate/cinnamic acid dioxygenase small subunit
MTLTLQEISDRMEITDAITRYSYGLDHRQWDEWDLAFSPDAVVDFSRVGMEREYTPAELREIFSAGDPNRISGQHLITNIMIWLDGDTARARADFSLNTLGKSDTEGMARFAHGGGWYTDELVRTADGWRIARRSADMKWMRVGEIPWPAR